MKSLLMWNATAVTLKSSPRRKKWIPSIGIVLLCIVTWIWYKKKTLR